MGLFVCALLSSGKTRRKSALRSNTFVPQPSRRSGAGKRRTRSKQQRRRAEKEDPHDVVFLPSEEEISKKRGRQRAKTPVVERPALSWFARRVCALTLADAWCRQHRTNEGWAFLEQRHREPLLTFAKTKTKSEGLSRARCPNSSCAVQFLLPCSERCRMCSMELSMFAVPTCGVCVIACGSGFGCMSSIPQTHNHTARFVVFCGAPCVVTRTFRNDNAGEH